jgi:septal ring factor EnvC (AmiA/AmiB activator)
MPEETVITPEPQAPAPAQQASTPSTPQEDWKPRYDGAVRKMQELNETIKTLQGQLAQKSSENEQLQAQLSGKDAEFGVTKSEFEKQLETIKAEQEQAQSDLSKLRALNVKVEVAKELGHPELITILDTFPDTEDKDQLKKSMEMVTSFATNQVKAREHELTAGTTPTVVAPAGGGFPQSTEEWTKYIHSLPDGEKREQAWDQYFKAITQE